MSFGRPRGLTCRAVALATALVCSAGAIGPAAARTMQQRLTAACAADVARYCPNVSTDPDAIKACVEQHRDAAAEDCLHLIDAAE